MTTPVVLITGALIGIGRATALAFAREGAHLVVSGRRKEEGVQSVYWLDPATGTTKFPGDPLSQYSDLQVIDASNGTQNLLYFNQDFNGSLDLCALNSAQLTSPTPTPTFLGHFDYPAIHGTIVDGKYVFGAMMFASDGINSTAIYQSDGTLAGTKMVGTAFTSFRFFPPLSEAAVNGGDVYFIYQPDVDSELLNPTTLTAQIWKADISTGQLSPVAKLYGPNSYYDPPTLLASAGDQIVFNQWNDAKGAFALWSLNPATGAMSVIQSHEGNKYHDPDHVTYAGGALYFAAYSEGVVDLYGSATSQVFIVGPAPPGTDPGLPGDFNHDNVVDAGDYISLRKQGGSAEDYALYRANFGRSLAAAESNLAISADVTSRDAADTTQNSGSVKRDT